MRKVYLKRDPDSNLNNYETIEVQSDGPMTVKDAVTKVKDEFDLNDSLVEKMQPYVNGILADWTHVVEDEDSIMLKTPAKDNG